MLERRYHEVREGETLEAIARQHGVADLVEIRRWNRSHFPVGESRPLLPGTRLLIYARVPAVGKRKGGGMSARTGPSQPIAIGVASRSSSSSKDDGKAWLGPSPE